MRGAGSRPDLLQEMQAIYDRQQRSKPDTERDHQDADQILLAALLRYGCADLVSLFQKIKKYYG